MKIAFFSILLSSASLAAISLERNKTPPSTYLAQKPGAPRVCLREEAEESEEIESQDITDALEATEPPFISDDEQIEQSPK